jgi:hypothetical protein
VVAGSSGPDGPSAARAASITLSLEGTAGSREASAEMPARPTPSAAKAPPSDIESDHHPPLDASGSDPSTPGEGGGLRYKHYRRTLATEIRNSLKLSRLQPKW